MIYSVEANKLYLEAVRSLPKRFIHGETKIIVYMNHTALAANPHFAPIQYDGKTKKWFKIKLPNPYNKKSNLLKLR